MPPAPTCPDCEATLEPVGDDPTSGHWHCPACDWEGIIDQ